MVGYSLPYLPVAMAQALLIFAVAALFGLEVAGSVGPVILVLLLMAVLFIGLGMLTGVLFTSRQVPFVYMVILLLAIFGGTWVDIQSIGGVFLTVGNLFPFAHALDAVRDVMVDGAGLSDIATDLYWVIGYTVLVVVLAVVAFRSKMQE